MNVAGPEREGEGEGADIDRGAPPRGPADAPLPGAADAPLPKATDAPLPGATDAPLPKATDAPPPDEIRELFVYLCVEDGAAAIEFYQRAFGARELFRLTEPDGRVGHAELALGPATIMLCDEYPELGIRGPRAYGGTGASVHLHVRNVDRLAERAVAAGAEIVRPPTDYSHGERQCRLRDPFGHEWLLGHPIEVPAEAPGGPGDPG